MRVVRRRPAAVLAATVLAMGALSACGGEPDAEPSTATSTASPIPVDPPSGSSSSSSETSSSTEASSSTKGGEGSVDLPEAATKHTQDGAVAFAKYYWEGSGRALRTGDPGTIRSLSSECVPCDRFAELVEADTKKGLHADVNPTSIGQAKVTEKTDGKSEQAVTLSVKQTEYNLVNASGEPQARARAADYDLIVYMDWTGTGWTVVDMYQLT